MNKSARDPVLVYMLLFGFGIIFLISLMSELLKTPEQNYNDTVDMMADRYKYQAEQEKIQEQIATDAYIRSLQK